MDERQLGLENSQRGVSQPPLTFPQGQLKSESEMLPVGVWSGISFMQAPSLECGIMGVCMACVTQRS
jgi:hypothetical protein